MDICVHVKKLRMAESRYTAILDSLVSQMTKLGSIQTGIEEQASFSNIKKALENEKKELASADRELKALQCGLLNIASLYEECEKNVCAKIGSAAGDVSGLDTGVKRGVNAGNTNSAVPSSKFMWMGTIAAYMGGITNANKFETIKSLLEGIDASGEKGAGALKDVLSYGEDFLNFFTGDKKGFTGAGSWCHLADSSIGVWSGIYDYFSKSYEGIKNGFFGDIAKRNVKVLGLSASCLGLLGSLATASEGLAQKKWEDITADYMDCGKDLFKVFQSGYELKHIGDVKSLAEVKTGPFSALDIYSAIGMAGVSTVSQTFRSIEKYSADGEWSASDTGALCIDISLSGIYGIGHNLTWGLDDAVFGAIEKLGGGDGNSGMSYVEQAAEGYKIMAGEMGKAIGNWWSRVFK